MAWLARADVHVDSSTSSPPGATYDPATFAYGPYGAYKPNAATTGLPAGLSQSGLTVITGSGGDYVITDAVAAAAGYKWDSVWFKCRVIPKTTAVIDLSRCWLDGRPASGYGAFGSLDCNSNPGTNYNVRVHDSVITAATPSIWNNGVVGHDFILNRCNIFGTTDGIQLGATLSGGTNSHGALNGCWVHDLSFFSPDTTNGTSERQTTHNDCIQWFGGNGLTTKGCFFDGHMNPTIGAASLDQAHRNPVTGGGPDNPFAVASDAYGYNPNYPQLITNSAFQFNNSSGNPTGWNSDSDWFAGGGYSVNIGVGIGGSLTNAKFARSFLWGPISAPAPGISASVTTDFSGCVYEDTLTPVKIYHGDTNTTTFAPPAA